MRIVCILLIGLIQLDRGQASELPLMAGAAVADITPTENLPMWGYGSRHAALSRGVLDPLKATAIVLQVGSRRLAIVGLDLGRSPAEESLQRIRQRILTEANVEYSLIAGSHTHHGPVLELTDRPGRGQQKFDASIEYGQRLETAIVDAIVRASQQMTAVKLGTAKKEIEGFNRNRHSKIQPGPLDRQLSVLRLDSVDTGHTVAVLVNFAAHPTSIPEEEMLFSADYIGALRKEVESTVGGVTVFMQGAAGDLSTNRGPHGDYAQFGRALGKEVVGLLAAVETKVVAKPTLSVKEDRFTFAARTNLADPLIRMAYSVAFFPELVANFVDEYKDGVRPRITVALLNGDIAFVGASGEFFCEHAIHLRSRASVTSLFFCGYCNGYHQYFPTIQGAAQGGYGADSQVAIAEVGAGELLMNRSLEWIYQMQGKLR